MENNDSIFLKYEAVYFIRENAQTPQWSEKLKPPAALSRKEERYAVHKSIVDTLINLLINFGGT